MPKIRDLGINVIPATMRPPEVGDGAACHPSPPPRPPQCHPTPADEQCCPTESESNRDKDEDREEEEKGRGRKDITPDERRELQQQLRQHITLQV